MAAEKRIPKERFSWPTLKKLIPPFATKMMDEEAKNDIRVKIYVSFVERHGFFNIDFLEISF